MSNYFLLCIYLRTRTTSREKTPPSSEQSHNEANKSAGRAYVTCTWCGNSFAPKVLLAHWHSALWAFVNINRPRMLLVS